MGIWEDLFGESPEYGVETVKPAGYGFSEIFFDYLKSLIGQPLPTYPGQVDPGLSPTLGKLGQMTQTYATSPLPAILGQAQGTLGKFMNPSFQNPTARMQMGAPSYFGFNGGQQTFGGRPMGSFSQMGMTGPGGGGGMPPMGGGPQMGGGAAMAPPGGGGRPMEPPKQPVLHGRWDGSKSAGAPGGGAQMPPEMMQFFMQRMGGR